MNVKFVSHKINRIRWEPVDSNSLRRAEIFCTGSWDNVMNRISIWHLHPVDKNHPTEEDDNEPTLCCDAVHHGDIMDLVWICAEHVAVASSLGSVLLYRYDSDKGTLTEITAWNSVHNYSSEGTKHCPTTFVTSSANDIIVSGGEDGRLNVLDVEAGMLSRVINNADSCTMNSGIFTKQNEVVTTNSIGQLKVWDIRSDDNMPTRIFSLTNDRTPVNCIDKHPTQQHILATGSQDGSLCVWDMRKDGFPITIMEAHSADMWGVQFHPIYADNLFSCSEDGSVWHWDGSGVGTQAYASSQMSSDFSKKRNIESNPWLVSEASKHRIEINNLIPDNTMPINSLSVDHNTLVCASDGEAIFTIPSLTIR